MNDGPPTSREHTRFSALDAVLPAPLAAPFFLIPFGLLVRGVARLATDYVAAVRAPAAAVAWWQWPWGWPGPHVVEALPTGLGAHPASDLSLSGPWPWRLADAFEVAGRALMALWVDGFVASLPLCLAGWVIAAAPAVHLRAKARGTA